VHRRGDYATAVDIEVDPQRCRFGLSQSDFALQSLLEGRAAKAEFVRVCCDGTPMAVKCTSVCRLASSFREGVRFVVWRDNVGEEVFVDARVARDFGVKRACQNVALAQEDRGRTSLGVRVR
jgi:hypothetical protein